MGTDPELDWENGNVCWEYLGERFPCSKEKDRKRRSFFCWRVSCPGVMHEQLMPPYCPFEDEANTQRERELREMQIKAPETDVHARIPRCISLSVARHRKCACCLIRIAGFCHLQLNAFPPTRVLIGLVSPHRLLGEPGIPFSNWL